MLQVHEQQPLTTPSTIQTLQSQTQNGIFDAFQHSPPNLNKKEFYFIIASQCCFLSRFFMSFISLTLPRYSNSRSRIIIDWINRACWFGLLFFSMYLTYVTYNVVRQINVPRSKRHCLTCLSSFMIIAAGFALADSFLSKTNAIISSWFLTTALFLFTLTHLIKLKKKKLPRNEKIFYVVAAVIDSLECFVACLSAIFFTWMHHNMHPYHGLLRTFFLCGAFMAIAEIGILCCYKCCIASRYQRIPNGDMETELSASAAPRRNVLEEIFGPIQDVLSTQSSTAVANREGYQAGTHNG